MQYQFDEPLAEVCERILTDYAFKVDWAHRDVAKAKMVQRIEEALPLEFFNDESSRLELLKPVFYRNKGAYLVGRLVSDDSLQPIVFALMHRENTGIEAVITERQK